MLVVGASGGTRITTSVAQVNDVKCALLTSIMEIHQFNHLPCHAITAQFSATLAEFGKRSNYTNRSKSTKPIVKLPRSPSAYYTYVEE